jgi:hypothetical protein
MYDLGAIFKYTFQSIIKIVGFPFLTELKKK